MSNIEIGSLKDNYFHIGSTGKTEPTDTYFFSLPTMGSARISAEGFSGDINMELRNKEGRLIKSISTSGKNTGILSIGAANLDSYPPEALAETKEGVVWVTPGQSSQQLAASIGAIDQGEMGHIPNTFIWKFPEGMDVKDVAEQLTALSGVKYAYPQVPVKLNLLYEPKDILYKEQWNLKSANVPATWDVINPATSKTVRGRGVTIGIVDDGLEYKHPDLASRYNPNLSRDFTDKDSAPSPTSRTIFTANLSQPKVNSLEKIVFSLPVNLTGIVKDVQASFDFSQSLPPNLPKPEELKLFLSSPGADALNRRASRRASFGIGVRWPGR